MSRLQAPDDEATAKGNSSGKGKRFEIKKWNAVAMWSWAICTDTCAICRNNLCASLPMAVELLWPCTQVSGRSHICPDVTQLPRRYEPSIEYQANPNGMDHHLLARKLSSKLIGAYRLNLAHTLHRGCLVIECRSQTIQA